MRLEAVHLNLPCDKLLMRLYLDFGQVYELVEFENDILWIYTESLRRPEGGVLQRAIVLVLDQTVVKVELCIGFLSDEIVCLEPVVFCRHKVHRIF